MKKYPLEKMDLVIFENTQGSSQWNYLKEFISFLKAYSYPRPYKFSHVEAEGPLIENLTLLENIGLHSNHYSSSFREACVEDILRKVGNPHLLKIFKSLGQIDILPSKTDDKTRKAVALIKAVVQPGEFIFLESPEKHLDDHLLKLFVETLTYQAVATGQIFILKTSHREAWGPYLTKQIRRDESKAFHVSHFKTGLENANLPFTPKKTGEKKQDGFLRFINKDLGPLKEEKIVKKAS